MKEIEFRAKNLKDEWEYGYYLEFELCDGEGRCSYIKKDGCQPIKVIKNTVGQFTGYIDSCKKRVYEGDILKITDEDIHESWSSEVEQKGIVEVNSCDYDYTLIEWADDYLTFEVIGNIYDNPELIQNRKKGGAK